MGKDLFQLSRERNVYLTLDLWAMLSPRLAKRGEREFSKGVKVSNHTLENAEERWYLDVD